MKKIFDDTHIVLKGWMSTKLNLKGNSLITFALIYGFSQDGESKFHGSIAYMMKWLNSSEPTVIASINKLLESDYIVKEQVTIDKVLRNIYTVNWLVIERILSKKISETPLKKFKGGSKEILEGGSKKILDNNTSIYNTNNNKTPDGGKDLFSKVIGLKEKIGEQHYKLINQLCSSDIKAYETLRGLFLDGRFELFTDWLEYKKARRNEHYKTTKGLKAVVNMFSNYTPLEMKEAVERALVANSQGLFPKRTPEKVQTSQFHFMQRSGRG